MGLKRRQFLIGAAALSGVGMSALLRGSRSLGIVQSGEQGDRPVPLTVAQSPPAIFNPPRGDVRLVVISDLNSSYGSVDYDPEVDLAIALIPTWQPDLVLCSGDMVAGQDRGLNSAQLEAMWAAFDRHVSAPLRQMGIPYGFTLGNHDASGAIASDGGFLFERDRAAAAAYWRDPAHDPGLQFVDRVGFPFYYSFQQNGIFYLVWDASTAQVPRDQIAWATRSLASDTAQQARLRIAIGHLPLYAISIGRDEPGEYLNNADSLRSLLEQYHVHTYISGHHHAYYPGHVGNLQLLHCGILGSGMRPLLNGNLRPQKTLTVIDVNLEAAQTLYTTYDMRTLQLIDQQQLPRLIAAPNGRVLRRDVEWADLSPAEQALEYVPSY